MAKKQEEEIENGFRTARVKCGKDQSQMALLLGMTRPYYSTLENKPHTSLSWKQLAMIAWIPELLRKEKEKAKKTCKAESRV